MEEDGGLEVESSQGKASNYGFSSQDQKCPHGSASGSSATGSDVTGCDSASIASFLTAWAEAPPTDAQKAAVHPRDRGVESGSPEGRKGRAVPTQAPPPLLRGGGALHFKALRKTPPPGPEEGRKAANQRRAPGEAEQSCDKGGVIILLPVSVTGSEAEDSELDTPTLLLRCSPSASKVSPAPTGSKVTA